MLETQRKTKPNHFACIYSIVTVQKDQALWVLQQKPPEQEAHHCGVSLSRSTAHKAEAAAAEFALPTPDHQEQPAGLEPAQHRRAGGWCWAHRPVGVGRSFPVLGPQWGKLSPSGETPFWEKRWQKVFLFWEKRDLKAVSRLFSLVVPAQWGRNCGLFSGHLYRIGFLARWCYLGFICPIYGGEIETSTLLFPQPSAWRITDILS